MSEQKYAGEKEIAGAVITGTLFVLTFLLTSAIFVGA